MNITVLAGGQECGRNGLLIENEDGRFLIEYGMDVQEFGMPLDPGLPLDAVFLSHAHLDHSGYLPVLWKGGYNGPIFATRTTLDITSIMLRDSFKVQQKRGVGPFYSLHDIERLEQHKHAVEYKNPVKIKNTKFTFFDAGHIPGSSSILIEAEGKKILYTGDINFIETALMRPACSDFKNIDVLITESTYSYKNHPDREKTTKILIDHIKETISRGGIVMLPTFSVGRTQEMLCMLRELKNIPIYLDGLGTSVTKAVLKNPQSVKDGKTLRKMFEIVKKARTNKQRKKAISRPSIIIASAGMMQGGAIQWYAKKLVEREDCSLILNGFQVPGTPGRTLLDTGKLVLNGFEAKPKFSVSWMDFSAHCGADNLIEFIKKIRPVKVLPVHGEHTKDFVGELKKLGFNAHAPENGESIEV